MMKQTWTTFLIALAAAAVARAQDPYPPCQLLDRVDEPAWQVHAGYVDDARVRDPNGRNVRMVEVSGGGGLYYWRTDAGDIDLSGLYDIDLFDGSGGVDLPDRVGALRLDAAYVLRQADGSALKVDLYPGVYSDLRDPGVDDVYVPFQVVGIQAFNPQLSGLLGVAIYPGFDRVFDPRFGIRWALTDEVSLDVMYPESRVLYRPAANWDLYAGVRSDPVAEYHLEDDDPRDTFRYEEARLYAGINAPVNDVLRVMAQAGWVFNRSVDFGRVQPERDVEDSLYVRVGVGGSL